MCAEVAPVSVGPPLHSRALCIWFNIRVCFLFFLCFIEPAAHGYAIFSTRRSGRRSAAWTHWVGSQTPTSALPYATHRYVRRGVQRSPKNTLMYRMFICLVCRVCAGLCLCPRYRLRCSSSVRSNGCWTRASAASSWSTRRCNG